jgi:hypothetical protein
MRSKNLAWLAITSLAMVALTACNIGATPAPTVDVNAVYTSAAATLIADFSVKQTQTALAIPPTVAPSSTSASLPTNPVSNPLTVNTPGFGTPLATFTPFTLGTAVLTAGPVCNDAVWMGDIGVQDGDVMKPGEDFTKTWAVKNSGTCTWDEGYALVFVAGDKMDGYDVALTKSSDFVASGASINFSVNLTAHLAVGSYEGCWRMRDDKGYYFGTYLCYKIEVKK